MTLFYDLRFRTFNGRLGCFLEVHKLEQDVPTTFPNVDVGRVTVDTIRNMERTRWEKNKGDEGCLLAGDGRPALSVVVRVLTALVAVNQRRRR
jgi:hypothetical protein